MTLLKRRFLRIGAVSGAALLAAACAETQLGAQAVKEVARRDAASPPGPELAPDAFDATGLTIWDGASTLEGVWIAHPLAQRAQRVRVTNLENQIDIEGAMFRRDPTLSGPSILVSSDAARLLGLQPGVPTELRIIALREGVYASPAATAGATDAGGSTAASEVETTSLAAPAPQETGAEADIAAVETEEEAPIATTGEADVETTDAPAPAADTASPTIAAAPPPPRVRERERPKTAITAADLRGENTRVALPGPSAEPAAPAPAEATAPAPAPAPAEPTASQPAAASAAAPSQADPAQPRPAQRQVAAAPANADASGAFQGQLPKGRFVQAGAFGVEPNAAALVQRLRDAGLPAQYVQRGASGSVLNIVMVGPLADDAAADAAIEAAARAGAPGARKVTR